MYRQIYFVIALACLLPAFSCKAPTPVATPVHTPSTNAQELNSAAMAAMAAGELVEGLNKAEQAIADDPLFPEAQANRAIILGRMGLFEEAQEAFDKAVALKVEYPEMYLLRGIVYELQSDRSAARANYEIAEKSYQEKEAQATMTPEAGVNHAIAAYLARGQVSGFRVINQVLDQFPKYRPAIRVRDKIRKQDRDFFLGLLKQSRI